MCFSLSAIDTLETIISMCRTSQSSHTGHYLCQVCGLDLYLTDGNYYRMRRRACRAHMKADLVYIPGHGSAPYRFCHQCAKFEPLTCFDGSRRSCRLKLAHRRIKEAVAARMSCSGTAPAAATAATADAKEDADMPAAAAPTAPGSPGQGSTNTDTAAGTAAGVVEPCSPVPQLHQQQQQCSCMAAPGPAEPAAAAAAAAGPGAAAADSAEAGARLAKMLPSQPSSMGASHSSAAEAAFLDSWDARFQQTLLQCQAEDACRKKQQEDLKQQCSCHCHWPLQWQQQWQQQWQLQQQLLQAGQAAAAAGGGSGDATMLVQVGCSPHTCGMMLEGCSSVAAMAAAAAAEPLSPWAAAHTPPAGMTATIRHHSAAAAAAVPAAACVQQHPAVPTSPYAAGGQAGVPASGCVNESARAGGWAAMPMQQQQQDEDEEDRELAAFSLSALNGGDPGAAGCAADTCLPDPLTDPLLREPSELLPPVLPWAPAAPGTAAAPAPQAAPAAVPTGCYTGSNGLLSSSTEVVSLSEVQPCLPAEYAACMAYLKQGMMAAADQLRQLQDVAARLGC